MGVVNAGSRDHVAYSTIDAKKTLQGQFEPEERVPTIIGVRYVQCALHFFIVFIAFGFRVNLSVAIVAMTSETPDSANPNIPTYPEWTQQGEILSAFFWGYIWPQVVAGYVATRFGPKWFLIATMGTQSIVGFCLPLIAQWFGPYGVMMSRALQGFCQGFLLPSIIQLTSSWAPAEERARFSALCGSAVPSGTVCAILVSGVLASSWYGWPMIFYGYGALGVISVLLFAIFGYNSPAEHPTISRAEKYYIENSLGHLDEKPQHVVPWKAIFTTPAVWALLATQCGFVFGFWALLTQIPTYMRSVLDLDIRNNSILSSLPYMVLFILGLPASYLSDALINKGVFTRTTSRKIFNSAGILLPSISLVMMGYVHSDETTKAVWLLIISVGLSSLCTSGGWGLNHMDLSPNHAGTLMGICNGFANIFAIIAPLITQFLVTDKMNPTQWRMVFFLAAGFQTFTGLMFLIWGSADCQPWSEGPMEESQEKSKFENEKL